jgi:uncharacterized membrane protein
MKLKKIDLVILIIPVVVMILLIPILPDKIPMHWNLKGEVTWYLDKKFSFVIGLLPFLVYESYRSKHEYK